ncbi:MAG: LptF/LptG family permease [Phycisphaerae bacterium]|jgi:lipopolysaccharide export system permease protein
MKTVDKYIAKSFITGYVVAALVLVGLRMLIDLFINLDEFVEASDHGFIVVLWNIASFYAVQSTVYFRDFAGIITVVAAAFTFGKMTRANELVALMASGVSLKRVIMPVAVCAAALTVLLVADQELIIPSLASKIVRQHDSINEDQQMEVECLTDGLGNLVHAKEFLETEDGGEMTGLTIILREKTEDGMKTIGWIRANKAVYTLNGEWKLFTETAAGGFEEGAPVELFTGNASEQLSTTRRVVYSYNTDLTPELIPIRKKQKNVALLSSAQLAALASDDAKLKDRARLYMQRYLRITEPMINFVMLLVALPVLLCRDKRQMKGAIVLSFSTTTVCFIFTFVCKMLGTEPVFGVIVPDIWAALPVLIFLPVAVLEISAIKT